MVAAVARDVIIVSGAAAYRIFIGPLTAHPSLISKINTLCQAGFISWRWSAGQNFRCLPNG